MKRPVKISTIYIAAACCVVLIGLSAVLLTADSSENRYAELQRKAVVRMERAEEYLKGIIIERGIEIEADDLAETGLVGPEFTELTSTPGNPDAKRTSLNPMFAAAMIRYFHDAGVEKGDTIAVGSSGSFPGFLIAVLCAAEEMDLDVRLITSLGASMHGATRVEFNIFDILEALQAGGFADFNLLAVSPGGGNDLGGSTLEGVIYEGTRELSQKICRDTGYPVLIYDDLAENIQERLRLYGNGIKLFVNIGGASPNCGASSYTLNFPQGLVLDPPRIPMTPLRGLNYEYAAEGIPVLNLLNVRLLASENNIPYDSVPMKIVFEGGAYSFTRYSLPIVIMTILIAAGIIIYGYFKGKKKSGNE